jgi:LysM repeat protein
LLCLLVFVVGSLLPPYVPPEAFALDEDVEVESSQFLLVEDGFLMKSSSLTQQGSRRAYAEGIVHTVREGENLEKIAQRYGIKTETVVWANTLKAGAPIRPDQELIILPVDGVLHTVNRGQTLSRIAELYSISVEEIAVQNKIEGDFIIAGQELIIPGGRPIVAKGPVASVPVTAPGSRPPVNPPSIKATPSFGVLQMPCNNCIYTQYFRAGHYAVDIQTRGGGPIFASEDGTVIRADLGWNGGYGNVIEVDHGNGLVTLYAHNKELYVEVGDRVTRGQSIAWMGNSGRVYGKTGIHIHFEVRVNGVKKNPLLYLK